MARRSSRFYNDPQIGAVFENIAGMFGPPDSGELVNYAQAAGLRQKNDIIEGLRGDPRYQGADGGVLAGLFNPTQSWQALEMGDATTRRGQDVTAATSRSNNLTTNQFGAISDMFGPLNPGQVRPDVPGAVSDFMGLPALPGVAGAPKPRTENEVLGGELERLIAGEQITDEDLVAAHLSDIPIEQVVGEGGAPTNVRRSDSVGQEPYFNKGAEAKGELYNYVTPDGQEGSAVFDGKELVDSATKAPLPAGVKVYKASAQGTSKEIGMGTNSNLTDANRLFASVSNMNGLVNEIETLVVNNPAAAGTAGDILSFAQDAKQVISELGSAFGEDPNAKVTLEQFQNFVDGLPHDDAYNPVYRQVRAKLLELAYASARLNNPSGEVSQFALAREIEALGQGVMGNDQGVLAVVQASRDRMKRKLDEANVLRGATDPLTPDQIGQPGAAPAAGGEGGVPSGWDPEDWKYLSEEEQQQVLSGGL